jgi:dTDP-4-dehydrorhamnose 3,5-epimerase
MLFTETAVKGAYIIELEPITDDRGFFARSWCVKEFEKHHLNPTVVQINVGFSHKQGTLRGIHYQVAPYEEVKLVRCTMGAIYDIAVDLRPDSLSYKQWVGVELTAENRKMLYVPEGCGHGYQTLADNTEIQYQTSQFYDRESSRGARFDDPVFGIKWPLPVQVISDADKNWPDYTL